MHKFHLADSAAPKLPIEAAFRSVHDAAGKGLTENIAPLPKRLAGPAHRVDSARRLRGRDRHARTFRTRRVIAEIAAAPSNPHGACQCHGYPPFNPSMPGS